ncbi:MAG: DNA-processing protein DprA [Gemmatimonadota bacterium]
MSGFRSVTQADFQAVRAAAGRIVTYGSAEYPKRLKRLHAPPILLHMRGPVSASATGVVAIVGCRRPTEIGRTVAKRLAFELASQGVVVVSGLAAGIDGAAHRGALEAGGGTIGVLGCGLRHVYPASHRALYGRLESSGLLLSEFEPSEGPRAEYFPRRNRIIAALAEFVIVVQAGARSGALITVDHAAELGIQVGAVPGLITDAACAGSNKLLQDGAAVITCARDVWDHLSVPSRDTAGRRLPNAGRREARPARKAPDGPAARALSCLTDGAHRSAAELIEAAGLEAGAGLALLSRLEVEGHVRRLAGGRFVTAARAATGAGAPL